MKSLPKTMLAVLAVGLLSCGLFCQQAQATTIHGTINFSGSVTLTEVSTNTFSLMFGSVTTTSGTGDYASFVGSTIDFENFSFNTQTLETTPHILFFETRETGNPSNVRQFFVGQATDGFLKSATAAVGPPSWSFTVFSNAVEASGTGFDSNGSASFSLRGTGTTEPFTFTGRFVAFPDSGSTVALLGIALAGLEGLRRKLRAS
jgi:hypothetical protein